MWIRRQLFAEPRHHRRGDVDADDAQARAQQGPRHTARADAHLKDSIGVRGLYLGAERFCDAAGNAAVEGSRGVVDLGGPVETDALGHTPILPAVNACVTAIARLRLM